MRTVSIWTSALVVAALFTAVFAFHPSQSAAQPVPSGKITVTGTATVSVPTTTAQIVVGVNLEAPTAARALSEDAQRMNAIIQALEAAGVPRKSLSTQGYNLSPNQTQNGDGMPQLSGYDISDNLQVTTQNLAAVGKYIDQAVRAGANMVNGVNFSVNQPTRLTLRAEAEAMANARAQALTLAQGAGGTLGPVVSVQVNSNNPPPIFFGVARAAQAGPAIVPPSAQTVSASVTVVYELIS